MTPAQLASAIRAGQLTARDLTAKQRAATAAELRRQAQAHFEHAEELIGYEPGDENRAG
jgi:hypothetical protein